MRAGQADITIVGLGSGAAGQRTAAVQEALMGTAPIFVRAHPGMDLGDLAGRQDVIDVDPLCQPDAAPGGRWQAAVLAVCDAAERGPVVLAIPGHPRFGEGLVLGTLAEAARRRLTTRVLDGISVVDLVATALGVDPLLEGAQCFAARRVTAELPEDPFAGGAFSGSPHRPMLFTHIYDAATMSGVARAIGRILPPDHPVIRIEAAGMPEERITQHTLSELPDVPAGPLVTLWVPAQAGLEAVRDPRTLQRIVAHLRDADGCPWDREQTHRSLRDAIIDEAYEVTDAIDAGNPDNLAEELGDLLLLITMHAQIAAEAGTFTIEDVQAAIATKIVGRHPHVFGDERAESEADLHRIWGEAKERERTAKPGRGRGKDLDGEPRSMPALTRAVRVLGTHPVAIEAKTSMPAERADSLLHAVADIVAAGEDPDAVLRAALIRHVQADVVTPTPTATDSQGE
jgi:tetrapyrrole methylase family protein/MazG family protein